MKVRPRRLRQTPTVRDLVAEVDLRASHLIQPYFLTEGPTEPITGFTDVQRWNWKECIVPIEADLERGIRNFLLFGKVSEKEKDSSGSAAAAADGVLPRALFQLRSRLGNAATLFSDVCLCPYTSHGHCGLQEEGKILNDPSLLPLSQMALVHAQAGVDFVAPSDMMDGTVATVRSTLDRAGFGEVGILAYSVKYASAYYGPFREALASSPRGDRKTYQMDFRRKGEARLKLGLDIEAGADLCMVKPALAYLDILCELRALAAVPLVGYSVSGEYEMVKRMAGAGLAQERDLALENLLAIRRAGASAIVTYFASQCARERWLT